MTKATFQADLLFDGEHWHPAQYFQVDSAGLFRKIAPADLTDSLKTQATALGVVIPGFINCHSHSFQRGMAGLGERLSKANAQDSFWTWREQMYGLAQALTPETFRVIADWLYIEMLEAGYTSVGEFHYLHKQPSGAAYDNPCEMAQQLIASAQEVQIRLCLLPALYQQAGIGKPLLARQFPFGMDSLQEYGDYHQILSQILPAGFALGAVIHSIRAVAREQLQEFSQIYGTQNIPIHIHIAEQQAEVEESLQHYKKRPVEFLLDEVSLNNNWTLIHATHITSEERQGIVHSGALVGICPITEANLGDGIFPMKEFLAEGGKMAIGSDAHIRIDPFEEMRWLEYSQRYRWQARTCLSNEHLLSVGHNLATQCYAGGARSLHLKVGALKEGFQADFLTLHRDHPSLLRLNPQTLWDELIFAGSRELIQTVYVAGDPMVFEGKHILREKKLQALRSLFQAETFS